MQHAYPEDDGVEQSAIRLLTELLVAAKPALVAADREWEQVAAKEAPDFRTLSLLSPDENGLSDIIAELLDPRASHGQGEAFLILFLSRCGSVGKLPRGSVTVHRESRTDHIQNRLRRIDLLINGGTWGIGIENKPWAGEQKDQLRDYAEHLQRRFENFLLIRLTGRDVDATSMDPVRREQLSVQGKFASWRYATELVAWVNECRQCCQAPRVTAFLDEFSRYITAEFVGATNARAGMEQKHLLPALESILKNDPGQLQSAAAIAEVFPKLRQRFVRQILEEVQTEVLSQLGSGWKSHLDERNFVETDWAQFAFTHEDWDDLYWVCLESQPKYGFVVLGVRHDKDKGIKRDEIVQQELMRLGWGKEAGGPWWDACSPLPKPFTNWTTGAGIDAVVNGRAELKTLLTKEFVNLCTRFKNPLAKLAKAAAPEHS
jgi:hypothetical protein